MGKNVGPGVIQVVNGIDIGAVIYGGGIEFVANGGKAIDAMVNMGGSQFILSGGKAYDTMVNFGGVQTVGGGGLAFSTGVNEGGLQVVAYNGETDFAIINRGAQYLKGVSYFSELMNGGKEYVAEGGHAYYTTIDANSLQDVQDEGYAEFADIKSGGKQIVELGAIVDYTDVHGGGVEVVMDRGRADHTTVAFTGMQDVFGWTNQDSVYGWQKIENGGIDHYSEIFSGGVQKIFNGGSAVGDTVHQGATQFVSGEADYTWLQGYQRVWQDGHAVSTEIFSGGKEVVDGSALWTFIEGGGQMVVESGGVGNQTRIGTGGNERVLSGGIELEAIFKGAGTLDLDSANCVGLIEEWQSGAKIDLRDMAFGANTTFGYNNATGMFSITDGQHSASLHFMAPQLVSNFSLSSDGHGGTLITDPGWEGQLRRADAKLVILRQPPL